MSILPWHGRGCYPEHQTMRYPVILGGCNLFDPSQMAAAGFHSYSIGRPLAEPKLIPTPVHP